MKRSRKDLLFVAIQFLLFVAYLFNAPAQGFPLPVWAQYTGLALAGSGAVVTIKAILDLSRSLSPFPTPRKSGVLIQSGVYRFIRHPIYTGILLAALGYSFWSESGLRLIVFICLAILFWFKARYEEELLKLHYPGYNDYMKRTGRFLPGV